MRLLALLLLVSFASGEPIPLPFTKDTPFIEYITQTKDMLKKRRLELGIDASDETISMNAPFSKGRGAKCVLMTHGYTTSPYEMRDMGEIFYNRVYLVRAILLPEHGTHLDDLLGVKNEAWKAAVDYGIDSLRRDGCKRIILFGQSTGGGLSILASKKRKDVDALVLMSPLVALDPLAIFSKFVNLFGPKWYQDMPEENPIRYNSIAWEDIEELRDFTKEIEDIGPQTELPLFLAQSKDDAYLPYTHAIEFYQNSTNPIRDVVFYDQTLFKNREDNLVSLSHDGVHIAPKNSMWGKNGRLRPCLHYKDNSLKFEKCKKGDGVYGELTDEILGTHEVVIHITYNPFFDDLSNRLNAFLDRVEDDWKNASKTNTR